MRVKRLANRNSFHDHTRQNTAVIAAPGIINGNMTFRKISSPSPCYKYKLLVVYDMLYEDVEDDDEAEEEDSADIDDDDDASLSELEKELRRSEEEDEDEDIIE